MNDRPINRRRIPGLLYLILSVVITLCAMVATQNESTNIAFAFGYHGVDILLIVTLAWLARRPNDVPVVIIIGAFLMRDVLTNTPVGLTALAILPVSELLRARRMRIREAGFLLEWGLIASYAALYGVLYLIISALLFIPSPPFLSLIWSLAMSVLLYPIVITALYWLVGLRKRRFEQSNSGFRQN